MMSENLKNALREESKQLVEYTKRKIMEVDEEYKLETIEISIERFEMIIEMLNELKKELEDR